MLRAYKYAFYRLYRFQSRWKWWDKTPQFTAFLQLAVTTWLNVFFLLELVELCLRRRTPLLPHLSKTQVLAFCALLSVPQYLFLLHGRRFKEILREFRKESPHQRHVSGVAVLLYIALSYVLLIAGAFARSAMMAH